MVLGETPASCATISMVTVPGSRTCVALVLLFGFVGLVGLVILSILKLGTAAAQFSLCHGAAYTNGALNCSVAITRWVAGRASTRCRYGPRCGSERAGRALKLRVQRHSVNT